MKKKLLLMILYLFCFMSLSAAEYGGCVILKHDGMETFFEGKDAQAAMDAAVEGDTLVFSNGDYPRFTMNKKVYILSSGYLYIDIDIPGNPSLDECLFQTYQHWIYLTIKSNVQKLYLSDTFVYFDAIAENVESIELDRVQCWNIYYGSGLKKIVANNCTFENILFNSEKNSLETASFTNCRFESSQINVTNANFTNCILYFNGSEDSPQTMTGCKFTKCLMDSNYWVMGENSSKENCYDLDKENFSSDKDYLLTNNYLGNDNTVVGEYGGANPYKDGRSHGPSAGVNLNKKGNRMSPEVQIYGAN